MSVPCVWCGVALCVVCIVVVDVLVVCVCGAEFALVWFGLVCDVFGCVCWVCVM